MHKPHASKLKRRLHGEQKHINRSSDSIHHSRCIYPRDPEQARPSPHHFPPYKLDPRTSSSHSNESSPLMRCFRRLPPGVLGERGDTGALSSPSADLLVGVGALEIVVSYRSRLERGVSPAPANPTLGVPNMLATDGIPKLLEMGDGSALAKCTAIGSISHLQLGKIIEARHDDFLPSYGPDTEKNILLAALKSMAWSTQAVTMSPEADHEILVDCLAEFCLGGERATRSAVKSTRDASMALFSHEDGLSYIDACCAEIDRGSPLPPDAWHMAQPNHKRSL